VSPDDARVELDADRANGTSWDSGEVSALRVLLKGSTDDEIVKLLDHYQQIPKGRRNPVAYASNRISNGRALADLERIRSGTDLSAAPTADTPGGDTPAAFRRLVLTPASKIRPRPVWWGWKDRLPAGNLSLIPGREGIGKSLFLIDICAKITRGTLPGCFYGTPRPVFYCATEDSWDHTIVPRLIAAGASLRRVFRIDVETVETATETAATIELSMPRDCDLMAAEIKRLGVALVAFDPLMSVIDRRLDTHNDRELRTALEPIVRLADETGSMVVGLAHFNKSADGDPLNLVTGSRAFTAVVRSVIAIARDPETGHCVVSQVKNNLGRTDLPSLTYQIRPVKLKTREGLAETGRVVFTGESERGVRDILADTSTSEERSAVVECAKWLREKLADGPKRTKEIEEEAKANGYSERTVNRARKKLGVKPNQIVTGKGRGWWLTLPPDEVSRPDDVG